MFATNPVLVEVSRGDAVESQHRGALIISDPEGREVLGIGNTDALIFPRSAIKPLQAIPLLESGAATQFALTDTQIALACASHSSEKIHVAAVTAWLARLGLNGDALECGPHLPRYEPALIELLQNGGRAERAHNNCSGKHTGFLTYCVHRGEAIGGYSAFEHPVQQAWMQVVNELSDLDITRLPRGIDGCGIPVIAMPLKALAKAMARFAAPRNLGEVRHHAIERIQTAMAQEAFMVAGSERFCTEILRVAGPRAIVKVGAEGVYCGALPELGLGIAIKIDDGATRAAEVVMGALLHALKIFTAAEWQNLRRITEPEVHNFSGLSVGRIQPSAELRNSLQQL